MRYRMLRLAALAACVLLALAALPLGAGEGPGVEPAPPAPAPAPLAPAGDDPILQARVLRALPDDAILAAYLHDLKQTRERLMHTGLIQIFQENEIRRLIGLLPAGAKEDVDTWYSRLSTALEKQLAGEIAFALVPPAAPGGEVEPLVLVQVDELAADLYDALRSNLKLANHWSDLPVVTEELEGGQLTAFSIKDAAGHPQVRLALAIAKAGGHHCLVVGLSRARVADALDRYVKNEKPSRLALEMLRPGLIVPDLIVHANKTALRQVNTWLTERTGGDVAKTPSGLDTVDSVSYSFSIDGAGFREAILFHCSQRSGWLEALTHAPLSDRAFAGAPSSTLALVATCVPIQTQGECVHNVWAKIPNSWDIKDKFTKLWPEQLSLDFDKEIAPALTGEWTCWASLDQDIPKPSLAVRFTQADKAKANALFDTVSAKLQTLLTKAPDNTDPQAKSAFRKIDAAYRNFVLTPPNFGFMADALLEPTVFITNSDIFLFSQARDAMLSMRLMTALNQVALADRDDFQILRKKISPQVATVIYFDLKRMTKIVYELIASTHLIGNVDLPLADTFVSHLDNVIIGLSASGDVQHPSVLVESYAPVGPILLSDALLFFFLSNNQTPTPAALPAGAGGPEGDQPMPAPAARP